MAHDAEDKEYVKRVTFTLPELTKMLKFEISQWNRSVDPYQISFNAKQVFNEIYEKQCDSV